jgi:hypothetical protein
MNRKTILLGGVLIGLIVLAYFYQGPLKNWQNNLSQPKNFLAKIDTAKIDKIEVISGGQTVVLAKQSGILADPARVKWKYNNSKDFYADPAVMVKIMENLQQAKESELELAGNNLARKSEFKTDGSGLKVKIYQADKLVGDFTIGNRTSDDAGSYISTADSPATYSVKVDLNGVFQQSEWRDLTIFSTDQEKINKIRFQYPNREFTVELKDNKWSGVLPEKFTVNKEKIDKLLPIMANLKAQAIPEQIFKNTGLDKHLIIIEATGVGIDNVLMVGGSQNGLFYAKKGNSDNIYLIDKSDRDELDKWIWQLK